MVAWRKDKDKGTNTCIVQASVKGSYAGAIKSNEWEQRVVRGIDKDERKEKEIKKRKKKTEKNV